MFQLGKTIVSEDIIEKDFVCNLSACKGACCVDGEAGAPIDEEEAKILEKIYPKVKPFLRQEGIDVIEKEGTWVKSEWGELETPLINGADCASSMILRLIFFFLFFITIHDCVQAQNELLLNGQWEVIFDEKNTALCAIEEAYNQGEIDWKKPVSCHLYPIRVKDYSEFSAVNYHKWEICDDACSLGKELQVPVYKFVKQALVRKFGQNWYDELEKVAEKHLR